MVELPLCVAMMGYDGLALSHTHRYIYVVLIMSMPMPMPMLLSFDCSVLACFFQGVSEPGDPFYLLSLSLPPLPYLSTLTYPTFTNLSYPFYIPPLSTIRHVIYPPFIHACMQLGTRWHTVAILPLTKKKKKKKKRGFPCKDINK